MWIGDQRTPIHALILSGPNSGMDVDVRIEEVKQLTEKASPLP